jgi:hypothetical protein
MRVMQGAEPATARLTSVQWLIIAVACVGFAFDLYETLMMALLVRPAIGELSGLRPGTPAFNLWVGLLFYVPNVAAGVFGLLGGYFAISLAVDGSSSGASCFTVSRLVPRDSPRRFGSY